MATVKLHKKLIEAQRWGLFLEGSRSRSMSHIAAAPSYSSSMAPQAPVNSEMHPQVPTSPFGLFMELMAVPKKKVTPYKKGLRNGPKALKPVPVIVRCKCCGRVKLPHFYCCSGDRGNNGGSETTS